MSLGNLPLEIFTYIINFLDRKEKWSLRLIDREWNAWLLTDDYYAIRVALSCAMRRPVRDMVDLVKSLGRKTNRSADQRLRKLREEIGCIEHLAEWEYAPPLVTAIDNRTRVCSFDPCNPDVKILVQILGAHSNADTTINVSLKVGGRGVTDISCNCHAHGYGSCVGEDWLRELKKIVTQFGKDIWP